jgi:hypothetical protein
MTNTPGWMGNLEVDVIINNFHKKTFKIIRCHGFGTTSSVYPLEALSGQFDDQSSEQRSGHSNNVFPIMKMVSIRIPGAGFGKNRNIIYTDQDGDTVKFFEYSTQFMC